MPAAAAPDRSRSFRARSHDRFWWHRLRSTDYVPPLYASLAEEEWAVMEGWFAETGAEARIAEINVPAMSLVSGLVGGSGVTRIVQLGHYYGYSALLLGFLLRTMAPDPPRPLLRTVDLDPAASAFTARWIGAAGLERHVEVVTGDSADPQGPQEAERALGGPLELLLVDSSHAYGHTLAELDLWAPHVPVGGLVALHDAAPFAAGFDPTSDGGVHRALSEWLPGREGWSGMVLNAHAQPQTDGNALVYKDACGLGLLQRVA